MKIFRKRKFSKRVPLPQIAELKKPHTKARKILYLTEALLVLFVIGGTIFGIVRVFNFSPLNLVQSSFDKLIPKKIDSGGEKKVETSADLIIHGLPSNLFVLEQVKERTQDRIVLVSKEGTVAIFSLVKDSESQLTTLQSILTKAKISKRKIKKIDLRFDKIAVTYK